MIWDTGSGLDRGECMAQPKGVGITGLPAGELQTYGIEAEYLAQMAQRHISTRNMGSLKKRRKAKINKHKRRKKLRANRHKKRTWQK